MMDLVRDAGLHLTIAECIGARDSRAARQAFEHALGEWCEACRAELAQRDRSVSG